MKEISSCHILKKVLRIITEHLNESVFTSFKDDFGGVWAVTERHGKFFKKSESQYVYL